MVEEEEAEAICTVPSSKERNTITSAVLFVGKLCFSLQSHSPEHGHTETGIPDRIRPNQMCSALARLLYADMETLPPGCCWSVATE